tara:strand:+ start:385 stop:2985 length:2601 start_codon:yes stop_codon:yes gene_type:complete
VQIPLILKQKVTEWKNKKYPSDFPALSEILSFNYEEDEDGNKTTKYLRRAQIEALETYWYLRVVEKTPSMIEVYKKLIPDANELLKSLEIELTQEEVIDLSSSGQLIDNVFEKITTDDDFVRKHNLETVRETLGLSYPSYILALAMGSGKTLLIGTIIAMEFCLSIEYQNNFFIKNALVFAPGITILGALKEISDYSYERLLPPRFYKQFISSVKIMHTRDQEKELQVTEKSSYNIIITNTEKIRIQKSTGKKQALLNFVEKKKSEEQQETANLRLQTIASLPQLGIFSDEGHHTYGQSLDTELKKVRKTVDYLAEKTNVICVINTTGTPYFKKQMLKDVIYWYGLSQGIEDGILKEVKDSITAYNKITTKNFVKEVITDFFKNYKDVEISDGAKSKIAIYFPQIEHVKEVLPTVAKTLKKIGVPDTSLVVNSNSDEQTKDLFDNRVNEVTNPYRVYLLVNKGTEGWNCPSLFATALARKLTTSNNFVLQAASRCLRQPIGNKKHAKIYLSKDNVNILDKQLQETYGENLITLNKTSQDVIKDRIELKKLKIDPLVIKKNVRKVVERKGKAISLKLVKPKGKKKKGEKTRYQIKQTSQKPKLLYEKNVEEIQVDDDIRDIYDVSVELSAIFRLDSMEIYDKLEKIYRDGNIPEEDVEKLQQQIANQLKRWEIKEFVEEKELSIINPEGFEQIDVNGKLIYVSEISYKKSRSNLFLDSLPQKENKHGFSFHYSPYNFDSLPEKDFLYQILTAVNLKPSKIEDIYFIGGLSSPKQTDILFEYQNDQKDWKLYAPDFLIRKKDGSVLIIEIKKERLKNDEIEGKNGIKAKAMKKIEVLNKSKLRYQMLFTASSDIGFANVNTVKKWMEK